VALALASACPLSGAALFFATTLSKKVKSATLEEGPAVRIDAPVGAQLNVDGDTVLVGMRKAGEVAGKINVRE
jgi:hypothetical protein